MASKLEVFRLIIPVDASKVEDRLPSQAVQVVAASGKGKPQAQVVTPDARGHALVAFQFDAPGSVRVVLGPPEATPEELLAMQTLETRVSARQWQSGNEIKLPVVIPSYYWHWWLRWCRTFVIRGRVVCPDGTPVPGAKVCAYDIDWWLFWTNTQLLGCATTDFTGAFELRFRWCCGFWPIWWWRNRVWRFDPVLADRVGAVLARDPDLVIGPSFDHQPRLDVLRRIAGPMALPAGPLSADHIGHLDALRAPLLAKLPAAADLAELKVWPWAPWHPWWDCNPDVIFKVTQDCGTAAGNVVIVDETVADTRWNVPTTLDVTLVANERACCIGCPQPPCREEEPCLILTEICDVPIFDIGGNPGAPATPAGYVSPGAVVAGTESMAGDRPFAGAVRIEKQASDIVGVDYYELEYFSGGSWGPLPPGGELDFTRTWLHIAPGPVLTSGNVTFSFVSIAGHKVVKTRELFEATGGLTGWGVDREWTNETRDVVAWISSEAFPDGTHHFRVIGWRDGGGGILVEPQVIPLCGDDKAPNHLVLTFDNRTISAIGHDPSHNCGPVHVCTTEPDTHIQAVRVNGVLVPPCDVVNPHGEGTLEIDFLVRDTGAHLGMYTLEAHFGLSSLVNLLDRPSSVVVPLVPGTQTGWDAGPPKTGSGSYGVALAQGAIAPHWSGGVYRLTVKVAEAFPIPCCYQLVLRAWKRTIVNCSGGFHHDNRTEYTLGVGVCPPVR